VGALKKSEAAEVRRFLLNSQAGVDGFELAELISRIVTASSLFFGVLTRLLTDHWGS
jgi:hypothetical protein